MAYQKTQWNPGAAPGISAANLNHLETQYDEVKAELQKTGGASDIKVHGSNLIDLTVPLNKLAGQVARVEVTSISTGGTRAHLPQAVNLPASAMVNGLIYVIGGQGVGPLNTNYAYDAILDTWTVKAPMPTARYGCRAAAVDDVIYVMGGVPSGGGVTGANEMYDTTTNTWTSKAPMPTPRHRFGIGEVSGVVYALQGSTASSPATTVAEAYDTLSNTWSTKASAATARTGVASAVWNSNVYLIGGIDAANNVLALNGFYNPSTNTWAAVAPMPTARRDAAATVINGLIYVVGGSTTSGANYVGTTEVYSQTSNSWQSVGAMPTARAGHVLEAVNGIAYAIGGSAGGPVNVVEAFVAQLDYLAELTGVYGTTKPAPIQNMYSLGPQSYTVIARKWDLLRITYNTWVPVFDSLIGVGVPS